MIINVRDYVDRWMNDYIVYHSNHLINYGDIDRAGLYFNLKYQEAIDKMGDDALAGQMKIIQATMQSQGRKAAKGLQVLDSLQSGTLLESTMDEIARGINEGIDLYYQQVGFENYESIIQQAKGFNKSLSKGSMSVTQINQFFDLLLKGVEQAGKFNIQLLDGLSDIGKQLSKTSNFQIDQGWKRKATAQQLTKDDIDMANKILQYLTTAVDKFNANSGILSSQSFSSTINNIFSTVIGEKLSKELLAKGIAAGINHTDSVLDQMTKKSIGNGKLTWRDKGRFNLGGHRQDVQNRTSKVNIFNQKAFNLSVSEHGQVYDIEIGTNTSVRWQKGLNENSEIHMVAGTALGNYFKSGTTDRYLAYNIIAHRWSGDEFSDVYRSLRASTAATFFNEWMTGTGSSIKGSKMYVNKVQFLMINGRIYPVMRIIKNICQELSRNNSWEESANMPFNMKIQRKDANKWQGNNGPNIEDAMKRSQLVNAVMNKLTISASLNGNILTKYAY